MAIDKFYIIDSNNYVHNIALFTEEDASRLNLKRYPVHIEGAVVDIGWTYLPREDTFLPPPRDILAEWSAIRAKRDNYLLESDFWIMPDRWATYTQDEQYAWSVYRKKLRDIPQDFIDPKEVVWPDKPIVEAMTLHKPADPIDPAV